MATIRLIYLITIILCLIINVLSVTESDPLGDSCDDDLDCGSNIKYEKCIDKHCTYCTSDNECNVNEDNDVCIDNHWCQMDSLLNNFDSATIATMIAIFVGAFIAAGGGLGGGGIFVPVFILCLNFDTKSAAALSQATIFGGSMVNLIMNSRESHTNKDRAHRPLTDFNTILILEPMLLGGTVIGVILNQILPDPIILICLILVLAIALYRMVKKGIAQFKKENEIKAAAAAQNLITGDSLINQSSLVPATYKKSSMGPADSHSAIDSAFLDSADIEDLARKCGQTPLRLMRDLSSEELSELDALVAKESRVALPMLWMGAVWIIVSIFALLRTGNFILEVKSCSALFWLLIFGVYPCLFVITFFIARANMKAYNRKIELKWNPAEGDIEWDGKKSVIYPAVSALSGLLGGLLGIGGGMIVSPLLLELGVLPRVASATSALAVLMTSSSSTFQRVLLGMIRYDYMACFIGIGIVGTFVGQTVVNVAIKKFGRNSIVVAAVAAVIAVAIVLMGVDSVINMEWKLTLYSAC